MAPGRDHQGNSRDPEGRPQSRQPEEVGQILKQAVAFPERLGRLFSKVFGLERGADLEISPREPHAPMDFESLHIRLSN